MEIHQDVASGKSMNKRPGLDRALRALEGLTRSPDGLVVAKLDRLSRSLLDFSSLMERAQRRGWAVVALDLGVDTTSPAGEMLANVLAVFAHFERRLIGQPHPGRSVREAGSGVRLGRPPVMDERVRQRIERMYRAGSTATAIAAVLTAEGVPTAHGGARWYQSSVRKALQVF